MRECHFCNAEVPDGEFCAVCTESFPQRRTADTMTGEERAAEMRSIGGLLEVPFDLVHARIEALVGRSVWTHEMGLNWKGLVEEARTRQHPAMEEVVDLVPEEKRLVAVFGDVKVGS